MLLVPAADVPAQVTGLQATVGAVRAVVPHDAQPVFVFKVGEKLVVSLGPVVAVRTGQPDKSDPVHGGKVHTKVLAGTGVKVAVRTAKGCVRPASASRHYGRVGGRKGTVRTRDVLVGMHRYVRVPVGICQTFLVAEAPFHEG